MCPANQIKENKASVFNFCTGLHKVVGKPSKLQNTWPFFCLVMQVSRYVRPYVTHSQNSVTGEVKFRLEALAAIQRDLFLRTVSSMQRSVFQGWLHLAQGSSVRKHWNEKQKRFIFSVTLISVKTLLIQSRIHATRFKQVRATKTPQVNKFCGNRWLVSWKVKPRKTQSFTSKGVVRTLCRYYTGSGTLRKTVVAERQLARSHLIDGFQCPNFYWIMVVSGDGTSTIISRQFEGGGFQPLF